MPPGSFPNAWRLGWGNALLVQDLCNPRQPQAIGLHPKHAADYFRLLGINLLFHTINCGHAILAGAADTEDRNIVIPVALAARVQALEHSPFRATMHLLGQRD
jgi:hypothetical protein